jgi:hypothetical protein
MKFNLFIFNAVTEGNVDKKNLLPQKSNSEAIMRV